jgi:N-acyl homoserine lactone hydrolase
MNALASITITPVLVADLLANGERLPVYVHVIEHPVRACWSTPA